MMASGAMGKFRLLIVPGSGCPDLESKHHFYKWAVQAFDDRAYFDVVECLPMVRTALSLSCARTAPPAHRALPRAMAQCGDPSRPDEGAWAAHMKDALSANHKTVVLGHDMGAAAGLRLLEDGGRLAGLVMVGGPRAAHHRDMIYASSDGRPTAALLEAAAEVAPVHYLRQRNWPAIKAGVGQFGVVVIHAADDPDVPVAEAGAVRTAPLWLRVLHYRLFEAAGHEGAVGAGAGCLTGVDPLNLPPVARLWTRSVWTRRTSRCCPPAGTSSAEVRGPKSPASWCCDCHLAVLYCRALFCVLLAAGKGE